MWSACRTSGPQFPGCSWFTSNTENERIEADWRTEPDSVSCLLTVRKPIGTDELRRAIDRAALVRVRRRFSLHETNCRREATETVLPRLGACFRIVHAFPIPLGGFTASSYLL